MNARHSHILIKKLKSTAGFTLAEQLMSVLFIGFLSIAVSVGIGAALAAYGAATDAANANQLLSRSVQEINNELAYSLTAEDQGSRFVSPSTRTPVEFGNDATDNGITLSGIDLGGSDVDSVLFVPKADDLVPYFSELPRYTVLTNTWSYTLQITKKGVVLKEQEMTVVRVMPISVT
jgi:hypothetical protein